MVELRRAASPTFKALGEGSYRFLVPQLQATFEVDFLRRDGGQLKGEVLVRCELAAARAVDGVLTVTDLNLSSSRTRASFAKDLGDLSRTKAADGDWRGVVEEFCLRVLAAERNGEPAVWLADVPLPTSDRLLYVDGFPLLEKHPLILFGDGGTGKSMLALYFAGRLALKGRRVGFFDWEQDSGEHRVRLGHLFPGAIPDIRYMRCGQPLCREVERLRRVVKEADLDFVVFDSIGFACDGKAEDAEQAMRYFQALRSLGTVGSLHVAHVKGGEGGDARPFGSVFWANAARSTWHIQRASREPGQVALQVALHHRKANTTARMRSIGFEITFAPDAVRVAPLDLAEVAELAAQLPVTERIRVVLRRGVLTGKELAAELEDVRADTLARIVRREKKAGRILEFPGDRLGLPGKPPEGVN